MRLHLLGCFGLVILFSVVPAIADDSCSTCGSEPRFPQEAEFLAAHGYPATEYTVLMSWSEAVDDGSGKFVTGYHLKALSGGVPFDIYSDGATTVFSDSQLEAMGIHKKNWNLPPIERLPEMPASVAKSLPTPPTPVGPSRALQPSAGVVAPNVDVAHAVQEDEERSINEGKGPQRIGLNVLLDRAIRVTGDTVTDGAWQNVPGTGSVWSLALYSPDALGIRVHFNEIVLPPGAQIVVYNPDDTHEAYGPYTGPASGRMDLWSATCFSDGVIIECVVPETADRSAVRFSIDRVTHNYVPMSEVSWAKSAGSCNLDVTCYPDWATTATAVGGIGSVGGNGSFFCSGSLLVDTDATTNIPYFLTANHCLSTQNAADSVEVYWLYQTSTCNGTPPDPATVPRTTGGAVLLATNSANSGSDFCLLRLNNPAANGVAYAGWSSIAMPLDTLTACIHHPSIDYKRISFGSITDVPETNRDSHPADRFYQNTWTAGVTEPGSSGSPLFIDATQLVIGQLWGGPSSCSALPENKLDYYGRFDVSYPLIAQYLDPSEPCTTPDPPTGVAASDGSFTDRVRVTWNTMVGATSYRVYRNTSNTLSNAKLLTDTSGSSYDDFSAAAARNGSTGGCGGASTPTYKTYYYWVVSESFCSLSSATGPDTGYRGLAKAPTVAGMALSGGAIPNVALLGLIILVCYVSHKRSFRQARSSDTDS